MDPVTGIGPVRITTYEDRAMVEAWTEGEDGRWDDAYGYVRVGSLGMEWEDYLKIARMVNTKLIYRAKWTVSDEGFKVEVLGPHPEIPFPVMELCDQQHICCRGDH